MPSFWAASSLLAAASHVMSRANAAWNSAADLVPLHNRTEESPE